jgi:hypothetical protein
MTTIRTIAGAPRFAGSAPAIAPRHERLALGAAFRYSGGVARVDLQHRTGALGMGLLAAVCGAAAGGCERGGKTPEEAYQRVAEAVEARDGERLFEALDLETRWSWMSVQRAQRESYDIVLSNFPEGPERERTLRRFEAGALSEGARELFARQLDPRLWTDLAAALTAAGPAPRVVVAPDGAQADVAGGGGKGLTFRRASDGHHGWGYAGFAAEGEEVKRRAMADLELMRTSAADYERAAARQGR